MLLDAVRFLFEDGDELVADDLALLLGIGDARQLAEEALAGIDGVDVEAELVAQVLLHVDELVLAQHAVVDEDAGQLIADGAMHQHGRDRRIHAARERADDAPVADGLANAGDGLVDEALRRPVGLTPQISKTKLRRICVPCGVWCTSGWNCTA